MKTTSYLFIGLLAIASCKPQGSETSQPMDDSTKQTEQQVTFTSGYTDVNGIKMYYEIYGEGKPLVLLHGGGSTIQTTFVNVIPELSKTRKIIAVELQAHGRTNDRNTPISFQQDADDVATLLKNLNIEKADIFGFSNGGHATLQLAMRHPEVVDRIIVASAFYKRSGLPPQFWEFMKSGTIDQMPQQLKRDS